MEEKVSPSRVALLGSEECEACKCADACLCPVIPSFREDEGRDRDSGCRGRMRWWEHLQSEMTRDAERERLIIARVEQARADRADFLATASVMLLPAGNRETICQKEETGRTRARALMTGLIRAGCVRLAIEDELRCVVQLMRIGWIAECRNRNRSRMDAEMARAEMADRVSRTRGMRTLRACTRALNQVAMRGVVHVMRRSWSVALTLLAQPTHADRQVTKREGMTGDAKTRMLGVLTTLGRERQVQTVKGRHERVLMCWKKQLRTEQHKMKNDGLIRAVEVGASTTFARVWLRLVGAFWLEKGQQAQDGWHTVTQKTSTGGGENQGGDRYDKSCTKCGWGGWLVHAGRNVCGKCEFQVRSWCGAAETWAVGGTGDGAELLEQAPQGRNVAMRHSRRQGLMRERLVEAIREKEVGICRGQLLDRFRQCYRQGKLEDLVGEWRAGKGNAKDESSMGGVALPRPRAGAAHAEVLAQVTRGCKFWLELKRSVMEWKESWSQHWLSVEAGDFSDDNWWREASAADEEEMRQEHLQYWAAAAPSALHRAPSAVRNSVTGAVKKKKKKKNRVAEGRNAVKT